MVGVNMVLAEFIEFKHGLYKSCGIECFEGILLEPCLLQPCVHVAACRVIETSCFESESIIICRLLKWYTYIYIYIYKHDIYIYIYIYPTMFSRGRTIQIMQRFLFSQSVYSLCIICYIYIYIYTHTYVYTYMILFPSRILGEGVLHDESPVEVDFLRTKPACMRSMIWGVYGHWP